MGFKQAYLGSIVGANGDHTVNKYLTRIQGNNGDRSVEQPVKLPAHVHRAIFLVNQQEEKVSLKFLTNIFSPFQLI